MVVTTARATALHGALCLPPRRLTATLPTPPSPPTPLKPSSRDEEEPARHARDEIEAVSRKGQRELAAKYRQAPVPTSRTGVHLHAMRVACEEFHYPSYT